MTSQSSAMPTPRLGFRDLALFFVVTGTSLRWIAVAASAGPGSILIWILALLTFYVPLALACLELAGRYPVDGGLYVWTREAFGEFSGFMAAWTYWTSNLPYFPAVLYFAASSFLFVSPGLDSLSDNSLYFMGFACLAMAFMTALNVLGLGAGRWLHNLGALGMWAPALLLIAMGFAAFVKFGSATHFTPSAFVPHFDIHTIALWSVLTFAYSGVESQVCAPRRRSAR